MSKYFKFEEFACKHCNENLMKESTIAKLDFARGFANIPFIITSGYRCNTHNQAIGGEQESSHTKGRAADIKCQDGRSRWLIVTALQKAGFNRIGVSKSFIHVDDDDTLPKNVIWTY